MIIHNEQTRQECINKIKAIRLEIDGKKIPWEVKANKFKRKRSTAMNALLYAWYSEIAKYTGEGIDQTRGFLKWTYGVPILMARGEDEFDTLMDSIVDNMTYEQIIKLFATDTIAVSSVMKVPEFLDYLTHIEQYSFQQKIPLAPNDYYGEAMGN